MDGQVAIFVVLAVLSVLGAFVWLALSLRRMHIQIGEYNSRIELTKKEVERVFSEEFREELRNRGRLYFEKIINENAMFMQQDLHLTASQLNEYMRESLKKALNEEFKTYTKSIEDAKQVAIESITKTQQAMEEQRAVLQKEMQEQVDRQKKEMLTKLDKDMASVVNHYLIEALSEEVDMSSQSEFIFQHLEDQKAAILEDIRSVR
ncbi:TPA: hypothetical protein EYO12_02620 [Candidatus Saccharibacteria bacterium]|nr:hypothetical protein [Candidatus Saccharibacteria bacterium]HIO88067.1 hypothetical protein [Candidatus Saccharibacteria bacterium]